MEETICPSRNRRNCCGRQVSAWPARCGSPATITFWSPSGDRTRKPTVQKGRMISVGDYVRRVIVGVDGSMGSLQALRHAVSQARLHDAPLAAVIGFTPPGGEFMDRKVPNPELRRWW